MVSSDVRLEAVALTIFGSEGAVVFGVLGDLAPDFLLPGREAVEVVHL